MTSTLTAMTTVAEHLSAGDIIGAQAIVLIVERDASVLPSSTFERVLRAAVKADCLTPEYEEFCRRAYGQRQWAAIVMAAKAA